MSEPLSANTRAILLLTAPLIAGRAKRSADLLTAGEYKRLALRLRETGGQPADLLSACADRWIEECGRVIEPARLERLLDRGFLLSQVVERWQARAIWVVSRADPLYPRRWKARLRHASPPVLYGCGDARILETGGLAVVGSRKVDDALIEFTRGVGRLAASAGRTLVSGGARGIDQAAMQGALGSGGRVVGVLADKLEAAVTNRDNRDPLLDGRLVLVSPYDPGAGFNVGHAMQRNKLVYALSDAALVVNAEVGKGGTWAGALEQLDSLRLVPVYVRSTGNPGPGLAALRDKGALPWPDPEDAEGLAAALRATASPEASRTPQCELSFAAQDEVRAPAQHDERQSQRGMTGRGRGGT